MAELITLAEDKIRKLEKINRVLMERVERSMDFSGGAFSLFQTAILLEDKVRARTRDLESTVSDLSDAYARLGEVRDEAEQAKQNLTAAIEAVSEGFALFDQDERLVLCNSPFRGLFPGLGPQLVPGLEFPVMARMFAAEGSLVKGVAESAEAWVRMRVENFRKAYSSFIQPLAGDRWLQVSNRKMESGATVIFQTDITDIVRSERVRHERELDEQSRLLQATIDHLPQAIAMFAPNLTLRAWNRSFANSLHLPLRQVFQGAGLGSLVELLLESRFRVEATLRAKLEAWLQSPTTTLLDGIELTGPDGAIFAMASQSMPDGGVVLTLTDVTQERQFTTALREANENLEQRVEQRTHELALAKQAAETANRSKTQFFAAANHDLLQPLNAARLFLSLLLESKLAPRDARLAQNADRAFGSVEQQLDSLLDISRLESGSLSPTFTRFPLAGLLSTLTAEFRPIAARKGIELVSVPSRLWVESDQQMLRRIVQNFVSNAVRYTEKGKILLGVRRAGTQVRIEIWDTGRGIPANKRRHIFEEFVRLEEGAAAEPHAMGLGLAIVDRMARLLGHKIGLTSALGQGSCFTLTVPQAKPGRTSSGAHHHAAKDVAVPEGATILVIENDLAILEGMIGLLESRKLMAIPTASINEALETLDGMAAPPDVIVADYHLDGGTGLEAITRIRNLTGKQVPGVIITADRSPGLIRAAGEKDIAVLWKPLKAEALFEEIAGRLK